MSVIMYKNINSHTERREEAFTFTFKLLSFFFCPTEAGSKVPHQTELRQEQRW